ncbi:MAG: replication-associated recombination protein A [Eubacteriales bacterium]|nr:replication-associated recombination protein A [Eubacteriales bacterium]
MNNLFDYANEKMKEKESPLASRIRAIDLCDIVGQEHILSEGKLLYRIIKADKITSIILYGPPGCGKTTIAEVIAHSTMSNFKKINATTSGKKDMEEIVDFAKEQIAINNKRTIIFIDEIHRFNKIQQDFLLPYVEDGTLILIGATTENPYFEVNNALLSRSRVFELHSLTKDDIKKLLIRAIGDKEKGLASLDIKVSDEAIDFLSFASDGDARNALNALELASLTTKRSEDSYIHIDLEIAKSCIGKENLMYDKDGDTHYNIISAFIKSMRGSDPDATVYYLARMIEGGEDIKFIARRIIICASEDVGNEDPLALILAVNASLACERVGLPEARIILSQAAIYVANAKKGNYEYLAIDKAIEKVKETGSLMVPSYLQGTGYKGASELGRGIGYKYPHDYPNHYVNQQYLPNEIKNEKFYKK